MKKWGLCMLFILNIVSCSEKNKNDQKNVLEVESNNQMKGSQIGLNLSAEEQLIVVNKEMDSVLTNIYSEYAENKEFIKNLKISQELWLKFHDAEMLARYPEYDPLREGSAFNLCWFSHKVLLKRQRLENLKVWLVGESQGEICSGSVTVKRSRNI